MYGVDVAVANLVLDAVGEPNRRRLLELLGIARRQRQPRALIGELQRHLPADADRCAGDDDDVFEESGHFRGELESSAR